MRAAITSRKSSAGGCSSGTVAFLCDARPASSRKGVAFVDGHREQGQRVFKELEGIEGYKRSCFYRLCC